MYPATVLVEAKDHPNGAVLINASDFVEGVHVMYVAPEADGEPNVKPKKK
jgi:hypothetical protein